MVITRCDTTFHSRIAGKYLLGKRMRGRWPYLFFLRGAKSAKYGNIYKSMLISLEFYLQQKKSAPVMIRKSSEAPLYPLLMSNHVPDESSSRQGRLAATYVSRYINSKTFEQLITVRSGFLNKRQHAQNGLNLPRNQWVLTRFGRIADLSYMRISGCGNYPSQFSLLPPMVSRSAVDPDSWPVTSRVTRIKTGRRFSHIIPRLEQLQNKGDFQGAEMRRSATDLSLPYCDYLDLKKGMSDRQDPRWIAPMAEKKIIRIARMIKPVLSGTPILTTRIVPQLRRPAVLALGIKLSEDVPLLGKLQPRVIGSGQTLSNSGMVQKREGLEFANEKLVFRRQNEIEREVAELNKAVVRTRELVAERIPSSALPMDAAIKKHIDMDRITDQVYRNIERKIRHEREMRGQ